MGVLDGKVAIITGAARGLGYSHASACVAEGAAVLMTDISDDGQAAAAQLGPMARFLRHDVQDADGWEAVVAEARARFGLPTILVNNAGIEGRGSILAETPDEFRRMLEVNVVGTWLGIKAVVPSMVEAGGGSIVNTSSNAGLRGYAGLSAYVASKWAVRGLTRSAALELGHAGIRVNAVLPGLIDTPMASAISPSRMAMLTKRWAIPRIGQPHEVSSLVVFLASEQSSYCTGADFLSDGGMLAGDAPSPLQ